MTAPGKLAHVVPRPGRIEAMVNSYCTALDAWAAFRNDLLAFVTYDEEHHRMAFINTSAPEPPSEHASGLDHVPFTCATPDELLEVYIRLRDLNVHPAWCVNHGLHRSMYYAEPDRNQVERQIDNFATPGDLRAWFMTGAFATNPIGVDYDPEILAARLAAGDPVEELVKQGSAGPR
jgi:hypothetical protein